MNTLTMSSSAFAPSPGRTSVNRRSSPSRAPGRGGATLAWGDAVIRSCSSEFLRKRTDREARPPARPPAAPDSRLGRSGQARGRVEPASSDLVPTLDQRLRQVFGRARVGIAAHPDGRLDVLVGKRRDDTGAPPNVTLRALVERRIGKEWPPTPRVEDAGLEEANAFELGARGGLPLRRSQPQGRE